MTMDNEQFYREAGAALCASIDGNDACEDPCSACIKNARAVLEWAEAKKPLQYRHFSNSMIAAIVDTTSSPASRIGNRCLCKEGSQVFLEACKDQPMCNGVYRIIGDE